MTIIGTHVFGLTHNSIRHRRIIRVQSSAAQSVHTSVHARRHGPLFTRNARNNEVIGIAGTRSNAADVGLHRVLTQCVTGQCERMAPVVHCYSLNTHFSFHQMYRFCTFTRFAYFQRFTLLFYFFFNSDHNNYITLRNKILFLRSAGTAT